MILVPKWKAILTQAWSVRLMALATVFSGVEVAMQALTPDLLGMRAGVFATLAGIVSMLAVLFRIMAQPGLTDAAE